jgi:hypothetical protein
MTAHVLLMTRSFKICLSAVVHLTILNCYSHFYLEIEYI